MPISVNDYQYLVDTRDWLFENNSSPRKSHHEQHPHFWGLTQATSPLERDRALASIRDEGGVLVVTSAASAVLDLSFANLFLHYDVPADARSAAHRLNSLDRITRPLQLREIALADGIFDVETSLRKKFKNFGYLS